MTMAPLTQQDMLKDLESAYLSDEERLLRWVRTRHVGETELECYALADLLEERGEGELGFAFRWMGWYGRRPAYRPWGKKPFGWYSLTSYLEALPREKLNYADCTWARLDPCVYRGLPGAGKSPNLRIYEGWLEAVLGLANALAGLQELLRQPAAARKGGK